MNSKDLQQTPLAIKGIAAAAAYLGIGRAAFRAAVNAGEVPAIKLGKRGNAFLRTDLDAWIASKRSTAA